MRGVAGALLLCLIAACGDAATGAPQAALVVESTGAVPVTTAVVPPAATTTRAPAATTDPSTATASSSTTTSTTSTTTVPPKERLVIHAVGDVGLSSAQHGAFLVEGYEIAWNGLDGIFERDDLTIINLECNPSELGTALVKKYAFRCDPGSLPVAAAAGIEVANLGNNHSGDYGLEALVDGRRNVMASGMTPIGAGADLEEANRPALFDVGGWRISVVGMSSISGGDYWWAEPGKPGVAPAWEDNIRTSVAAAAEQADIVIVMVHWGIEAWTEPAAVDVDRAAVMIEAGADVIVGHHSHQLQPLEFLGEVPVFWSLGDFVWPVLEWRSEESAIAEIIVEPDGTVSARMIPAYIVSHGHPELRGDPDPSLEVDDAGPEA